MKTTKQNIERLIDELANKTLSFGCEIEDNLIYLWNNEDGYYVFTDRNNPKDTEQYVTKNIEKYKILGHPIMISTVLEKIKFKDLIVMEAGEEFLRATRMIYLWCLCGATKSLQQIIEESGWEHINPLNITWIKGDDTTMTLKDPNARNLAEFLINVFIKL